MAMRATTVRFREDLWDLLEREAGREGVSAAQLVREATLLRVGVKAARRGDESAQTSVQALAEQGGRRSWRAMVSDPDHEIKLACNAP